MESKSFETLASLKAYLASFDSGVLFRGQTTHYANGDGFPNISSSMDRKGCQPPLMFKWTHYAHEMLRLDPEFNGDFDTAQALLQHYGWRSFYVDCSSNYAVAAWFAANRFKLNPVFRITEDCFEEGFLVHRLRAEYVHNDEAGHLYVISREYVKAIGEVFDLETVPENIAARPNRQSGVLVGPIPFRNGARYLDASCVLAHIMAPSDLFREVAAEQGFAATTNLFPSPEEDRFLRYLQSLPLVELAGTGKTGLRVFAPALSIPDYDVRFHKISPDQMAFESPFWMADRQSDLAPEIAGATFFKVPDKFFHVWSFPEPMQFPTLRLLLEKYRTIVIESSRLLRYPLDIDSSKYMKGIVVALKGLLVAVRELVVIHPGHQVAGSSVLLGHHYKWNGDALQREITGDDCPCNNDPRHARLLTTLAAFSEMAMAARQVDSNIFELDEPK